jgi:hypothetical protein
MVQTVGITVSPEDRGRLSVIIGGRNRSLKHTQRAWIIVLPADG